MLFNKRFLQYPATSKESLESIIAAQKITYSVVINNNRLEQLETAYGIKIPDDYRNFLLTIGNGGTEDDLLPIEESLAYDLIQRHSNTYLLILTNYIDIYIGLAVDGPDYGSVWNIREECCYPQSNQYQDLIRQAKKESIHYDQLDPFLDKNQNRIPRMDFENWYKLWLLSKQQY